MDDVPTVQNLDLKRFMGAWYVLAHIPIPFSGNAYNAVERYKLQPDGTVDVLYTYNQGGFTGDLKVVRPTGFPDDGTLDGEWGMRIIWPFKSDYRVSYIDEDYQVTIIGRERRDFVWIMARSPAIDERTYELLVQRVRDMGYDTTDLIEIPQQPLEQRTVPDVAKNF
ncbi:MAG: lipocalin family protein [Pseudomonadota bacterium]